MCFIKTKESKLLIAKRDITVYKVGVYADVHMLREDVRGICHRPCIYNDKGRCDMWDELSVPDESEKCDNQIDV